MSGTIISYGDANESVTVTLLQDTTVIGSPQVLPEAVGSAPYSATYSFDTVPAGTYMLKVEKKGHAPFTKEITVGDSNVTEDVTMYLWGDVDRNGKINAMDVTLIRMRAASGIPYGDIRDILADVTGDGRINAMDVTTTRMFAGGKIDEMPADKK